MHQKHHAGFTLIEMVCTIIILGVLAASAMPKLMDIRSHAYQASIDGYAGALASAMRMNYVGCISNSNAPEAGKCIKVEACTDGVQLLRDGVPSTLPGASDSHLYIEHGFISNQNGVAVQCNVQLVLNRSPVEVYNSGFIGLSAGN